MAFSRVQGTNSLANAGTHAIALTGVTATNTLVLRIAIFNPTVGTIVSDSALQTWVKAEDEYGSGDGVETWVLVNANSGTHTLSLSAYGDAINAELDEYTSTTTPHAIDKTNRNTTANPTTLSSGATGTLSTSDQIALAVMTHNGGAPSLSVEAGWTDRFTDTDNNNHQCISCADKVLSVTTSEAHDWTIGSPTPGEGLACIITLMEDSGPPAAPIFYSAVYPNSFEGVDESLESFLVTAFVPRLDFFSAVYPDKVFRKKKLPLSEFTLISPPEFDGYFGATYPDSLESKEDIRDSQIVTPIVISAPVLVTYFGAIYPDTVDKIRVILESGITGPVFTPVAPPLTAKNWDVIAPDILFKKRDYSDFPSVSELRRTITVPGAASNLSLIWFYNLRIRLDVKKAVDSGNVEITATGGTVVTFNKTFKDIDSITLTVLDNTVPITAMYDFVDAPNPTDFTIYIFDSAGVETSGFTVSWKARGII